MAIWDPVRAARPAPLVLPALAARARHSRLGPERAVAHWRALPQATWRDTTGAPRVAPPVPPSTSLIRRGHQLVARLMVEVDANAIREHQVVLERRQIEAHPV